MMTRDAHVGDSVSQEFQLTSIELQQQAKTVIQPIPLR